jgi:hypothetical protein
LTLALREDIFRRAVKVALIVGMVLLAINYGDKIIAGTVDKRDILKMALTCLVPYCVSTYVAVSTVSKG